MNFGYLGCACQDQNMGMVSPLNVAVLGALGVLPRTLAMYDRAIAKVKADINTLKKKKSVVKLKARKVIIEREIIILKRRLEKLESFRKIKAQKKGKGQNDSIEGEDTLLDEAIAPVPLVQDLDLEVLDQETISTDDDGMDMQKLAIYGAIGIGAILLGIKLFKKDSLRKNRVVLGKKRKNPRKKTRRSKRK